MAPEERQRIDRSLLRSYPELADAIRAQQAKDLEEEVDKEVEEAKKSGRRTSLDPFDPDLPRRSSLDPL